MKLLRLGRKTVFGLIIALAAIPALSFAQVYGCATPFSYNYNSCSSGTLHVYMLVNNNSSAPQVRQPADFSITVQAQNPSPATFPGSQSGVNVILAGSYSVTALQMQNFSPSYSQGCTGSVSQNKEATCVITESWGGGYLSAPQPYQYPYPYTNSTLACAPAYQTITLGQSASFTAVGGSGPYSWSTPESSYQGIGPVFNTSPRTSGTQTINVSSSGQTATCTVNVVGVNGPVSYTPTSGVVLPIAYAQPAMAYVQPGTTLTASYVPALPNTGFEPKSAAPLAFAFAIIIALGIFIAPYVRKTLAHIA